MIHNSAKWIYWKDCKCHRNKKDAKHFCWLNFDDGYVTQRKQSHNKDALNHLRCPKNNAFEWKMNTMHLRKWRIAFWYFTVIQIPHRLYALNNIISMCTDNEDIKTDTVSLSFSYRMASFMPRWCDYQWQACQNSLIINKCHQTAKERSFIILYDKNSPAVGFKDFLRSRL